MAVYSEKRMKHMHALCGENRELSYVQAGGKVKSQWLTN
jgi:hypothetical protein